MWVLHLSCTFFLFAIASQAVAQLYLYQSQFGTAGSGNGQLNNPQAVTFDPVSGNIIVADTDNSRVQLFSSRGVYLAQFGTAGTGNGQFIRPVGVAIDPLTQNILVLDGGNNRVQTFSSVGVYLSQFGAVGSANGQFNAPTGIAVDPTFRNVVVLDTGNNRIELFDPIGTYLSSAISVENAGGLGTGIGLDAASHNVVVMPIAAFFFGGFPRRVVELYDLWIFSTAGNQLSDSSKIQLQAAYDHVSGIAVDPIGGNIAVVRTGNNVVTIFRSDGSVAGTFGNQGSGIGQLNQPTGIAINPSNHSIALADSGNNRIQVFTPSSPSLLAAILPSSRSVPVGVAATAFATVINTSPLAATGCTIAPATSVPASFAYQTTDPTTNALTGSLNTPVVVGPAVTQTFVIAMIPNAPFAPTDIGFTFACSNAPQAPSISGLNTILLSSSTTIVPDMVAIAVPSGNDGGVLIPSGNPAAAFAVGSSNVGASGMITVSADTGAANLPVTISVCQTNPQTGQCISPVGLTLTTSIGSGATPTFAFFVMAAGPISYSPAMNRVFVRFKDSSGAIRGQTSIAIFSR